MQSQFTYSFSSCPFYLRVTSDERQVTNISPAILTIAFSAATDKFKNLLLIFALVVSVVVDVFCLFFLTWRGDAGKLS